MEIDYFFRSEFASMSSFVDKFVLLLPRADVFGEARITSKLRWGPSRRRYSTEPKRVDMNHFHIRWSNSTVDWEAFGTEEEARTEAERLKLPNESYTIEELAGECQLCKNFFRQVKERLRHG
jgi:hypothetical protein